MGYICIHDCVDIFLDSDVIHIHWFQAQYSHFGARFPFLKQRFYVNQSRVGEDIVKQAVFKLLTESSSEVPTNSGLGIHLPTSPSANLHPQKHQAKNTISPKPPIDEQCSLVHLLLPVPPPWRCLPSKTLEDAKPQANRKWRISFSKIKILQEATSFDLYADLFGNEIHSKIQHAVLCDRCNDSLPSLFSTSSKVMVFGNQTHRPSKSSRCFLVLVGKVGPPNLHSK